MPIQFSCHNCGHELHAPDDYAGGTARCKKCRTTVRIPRVQEQAPQRQSIEAKRQPPSSSSSSPLAKPSDSIEVACPKCKKSFIVELGGVAPSGKLGVTCDHCGADNRLSAYQKELSRQASAFQKEKDRQASALQKDKDRQTRLEHEKQKREEAEESRRLEMAREAAKERAYEEALVLAKKDQQIARNWFCHFQGKDWGPMPESRLQGWISERRVKAEDMVRPENVDAWIKLSDLAEIFAFPAQSPRNTVEANEPSCPKCGSTHISANKKGMKKEEACCGAILLGPLGLLCGLTDQVVVTCVNCGHQWKVGG